MKLNALPPKASCIPTETSNSVLCSTTYLLRFFRAFCRHKFRNHLNSQNGYLTLSVNTVLIISTKIVLFSGEYLDWLHYIMEILRILIKKLQKLQKVTKHFVPINFIITQRTKTDMLNCRRTQQSYKTRFNNFNKNSTVVTWITYLDWLPFITQTLQILIKRLQKLTKHFARINFIISQRAKIGMLHSQWTQQSTF